MKNLLRKFLGGAVVGVGMLFGVSLIPLAYSAGIPLYTGANINFQSVLADMNALINNINLELTNYLTFGNPLEGGEMAITSANAFVGNGTVAVGAIGSKGVTGTIGVIHEWLAIVDEAGGLGYVPVYN